MMLTAPLHVAVCRGLGLLYSAGCQNISHPSSYILGVLSASRRLHDGSGDGSSQVWHQAGHTADLDFDVLTEVANSVANKMVGPGVLAYSVPAAHAQRGGTVGRDNSALTPDGAGLSRCAARPAPLERVQRHKHCSSQRMSRSGRNSTLICSSSASTAETSTSLTSLPLLSVINVQGYINPEVPQGTEASVFAIFDENKKLQFVGFSKDLRNSLRTVFSRRPDKTFFYKAANLAQLDQKEMLDIRTAWFEEVGGPPTGNKLALERKAWSEPASSGAISDRGRYQAAESEVVKMKELIRLRGCNEEFIADPALLQEGKVDFLPAAAMSEEDLDRQRQVAAELAKRTRWVDFEYDGQPSQFELRLRNTYKTNGGHMFDLNVTFENKETVHRVIVGKEYYEAVELEPEEVLAMTFAFLLRYKVPRQTEGLLLSSQFNINYFAISEVDQWFGDFSDVWTQAGKRLEGDSKFWRMNRLHGYGGFAWDREFDKVQELRKEQEKELLLNASPQAA